MASKPGHSSDPLLPPVVSDVRGLPPVEVAENQRRRIELAMVAAVDRHGYAGTTLREVVALAGVSKSTFYDHFESKQECFLATFDEIVAAVAERVRVAYQADGDFRQKLTAAVSCLMQIAVAEPQAAMLAAVESLSLGSVGIANRERSSEAFEPLIKESFDRSPSRKSVPTTMVRGIAAGTRGVIYRHVRENRIDELPGTVDDLVDWALAYQARDSDIVRIAIRGAASSRGGGAPVDGTAGPDWREPPDSPRSRAELSQRERITRAIAQLVVEKGYETLSIPSISAKAGTSNQTFYENFDNKRAAFLAAFDAIAEAALVSIRAAYEETGEGTKGVGAAIRTALDHLAADELLARLTFLELQAAGAVALDRADSVMDRLTGSLPVALGMESARDGSEAVSRAIGSGCWSVVQHQLIKGGADSLPQLAPDLARMMLTPLSRPAASTR
ncbi:MAG TPA: TetR/AcrR family transcriptional regulator [Solirubrobacterales bacterium]|jgi:AcrR family transcriptional regulator